MIVGSTPYKISSCTEQYNAYIFGHTFMPRIQTYAHSYVFRENISHIDRYLNPVD
jgi:hypothetical protein